MSAALTGAPAEASPEPVERGAMPSVARPRAGLSCAAILVGAVLGGILLFTILDARRRALSAPAVQPTRAELIGPSQAPPPLYIPPAPRAAPRPRPSPLPPPPAARPASPPQQQPPAPSPAPEPPPRTGSGAILVMDASQVPPSADPEATPVAGARAAGAAGSIARSRAGSIANRSTTVPQGTLIPAVLETALDSTGAGYVRALVQRDVRGFDGTRVLIPRGSRLIGEYSSQTNPGQKRAFVIWTRLIRPDGVTMALLSPATDPVGVGGVRAKVNSHFFERFAGSLLQSAMMIGGNLVARSAGDSVLIALPGSLPGAEVTTQATQIPPTLSVRQGTSISVFVARDLDFTGAEARP